MAACQVNFGRQHLPVKFKFKIRALPFINGNVCDDDQCDTTYKNNFYMVYIHVIVTVEIKRSVAGTTCETWFQRY